MRSESLRLRRQRSSNPANMVEQFPNRIGCKNNIRDHIARKPSIPINGNKNIINPSELKFPMPIIVAMRLFADRLTIDEKAELLDYSQVYYLGNEIIKGKKPVYSKMYDDDKGDLITIVGEHIAYRYEILDLLGNGSFAQAIKCYDHKEKKLVALKIIKNKKKLIRQANVEVKLLKYIQEKDINGASNIIKVYGFFSFRKHIVNILNLNS
jgi:dual specificity tyrosine-phosphorylation-regulated kinase 2/3/4